jgi:uncharacterized coiled-coil protein SlyX
LNIFKLIKSKYKLETNIKGIEYIEALEKEIEQQQKKIALLASAVAEDDKTKERYADEIKELIGLNLWSARRLHKIHKEFAYDELEKITGQKHERL